jgi:diguanylate cyclase (GGDEF)-like protein
MWEQKNSKAIGRCVILVFKFGSKRKFLYFGTINMEEKVKDKLHYDTLTLLPNRKLFYDQLNKALEDALLGNTPTSVLFLDLDMFKNINDTLGHNIGDKLLQSAAGRLAKIVPETSFLARMGGDEFAVLLSGIESAQEAVLCAMNILDAFGEAFTIQGHELFISPSIGIASCPDHGAETHVILRNAASAMYRVKESGRNNYQLYSNDINHNTLDKYNLLKDLRHAITNGELVLHYQPKVDGKTGDLVGMEALVRWQHPEKGLLYPADFIPLAEETGVIKYVDEWVLNSACTQLKNWRELGFTNLRLAVNLSAWQFKEQHLPEIIMNVLSEKGLDSSFLELEITETAAMENLKFTVNTLSKLISMGINISIDDFGTGYSSLNYLKHFPINFLKIDQSFVADIIDDKNTFAIVKAIIDVAHTLNLKVIAEGVETREQLLLLQQLGCDELQGYYISKPLPLEEAQKHINTSML